MVVIFAQKSETVNDVIHCSLACRVYQNLGTSKLTILRLSVVYGLHRCVDAACCLLKLPHSYTDLL